MMESSKQIQKAGDGSHQLQMVNPTITPIGKALAHANAQRYNNGVPDIND